MENELVFTTCRVYNDCITKNTPLFYLSSVKHTSLEEFWKNERPIHSTSQRELIQPLNKFKCNGIEFYVAPDHVMHKIQSTLYNIVQTNPETKSIYMYVFRVDTDVCVDATNFLCVDEFKLEIFNASELLLPFTTKVWCIELDVSVFVPTLRGPIHSNTTHLSFGGKLPSTHHYTVVDFVSNMIQTNKKHKNTTTNACMILNEVCSTTVGYVSNVGLNVPPEKWFIYKKMYGVLTLFHIGSYYNVESLKKTNACKEFMRGLFLTPTYNIFITKNTISRFEAMLKLTNYVSSFEYYDNMEYYPNISNRCKTDVSFREMTTCLRQCDWLLVRVNGGFKKLSEGVSSGVPILTLSSILFGNTIQLSNGCTHSDTEVSDSCSDINDSENDVNTSEEEEESCDDTKQKIKPIVLRVNPKIAALYNRYPRRQESNYTIKTLNLSLEQVNQQHKRHISTLVRINNTTRQPQQCINDTPVENTSRKLVIPQEFPKKRIVIPNDL